jgi:hypothetical protein
VKILVVKLLCRNSFAKNGFEKVLYISLFCKVQTEAAQSRPPGLDLVLTTTSCVSGFILRTTRVALILIGVDAWMMKNVASTGAPEWLPLDTQHNIRIFFVPLYFLVCH